jgi:sodium-dependent dicarboxylate transporter 2/3/5
VLIGIAVAASAAMCLPISTPPNAIAYSSGMLEQKHIVKLGVTIGVLGLVLGYLLVFLVGELHLIW